MEICVFVFCVRLRVFLVLWLPDCAFLCFLNVFLVFVLESKDNLKLFWLLCCVVLFFLVF